jgi:DNA (cytosine-5)-methyltransferase 1
MAGWTVPWANEFVDAAADTYSANSGATVDRRDIREVKGAEILAAVAERLGDSHPLPVGELDLLEGSPPCSSFSMASGNREKHWGKEKSYSDAGKQRTDDLFFEWLRLVGETKPRAILAENVPAMIIGRALEEYAQIVVRTMRKLGYRVTSKLLTSSWYGTPTSRTRLIFAGLREDVADEAPTFPPPTSADGRDFGLAPRTLQEALEVAEPPKQDEKDDASMERFAVGRTWHRIVEERAKGRDWDMNHEPCRRCGEKIENHPKIETTKTGAVSKVTCRDGEPGELVKEYFLLIVPRLNEPCPTILATSQSISGTGSVTHPTECRKFAISELLAIHGFPADFKLTGELRQQRERIGRAVTPPLYEAVGTMLSDAVWRWR